MAKSEADLPFPDSLCHACAGCRYVRSARSVFMLCTIRPDKYPRQPLLRCPDHAPLPPEAAPPKR